MSTTWSAEVAPVFPEVTKTVQRGFTLLKLLQVSAIFSESPSECLVFAVEAAPQTSHQCGRKAQSRPICKDYLAICLIWLWHGPNWRCRGRVKVNAFARLFGRGPPPPVCLRRNLLEPQFCLQNEARSYVADQVTYNTAASGPREHASGSSTVAARPDVAPRRGCLESPGPGLHVKWSWTPADGWRRRL